MYSTSRLLLDSTSYKLYSVIQKNQNISEKIVAHHQKIQSNYYNSQHILLWQNQTSPPYVVVCLRLFRKGSANSEAKNGTFYID